MKLTVKKSKIESAVKNICRVINNKNALPILGDIMCSVNEQDKTLTLLGSDSEVWLKYMLELEEAEGSGDFCIGAKLLLSALTELKDQPLEIITDTENVDIALLRIIHETGNTNLPLDNADEYPRPQEFGQDATMWYVDPTVIKRVVKRTMYATGNDDLRPVMSGVFFDHKEGAMNIVASDGHQLIRTKIQDTNEMIDGQMNMPKKAAKMLPELLAYPEEDTSILFNETTASVEHGNMTLQFRLIEGKYPNYGSVIPKDSPYSLTADRRAMLTAVRNVAHFTSSSHMIEMEISGNQKMTLHGNDYDFSTTSKDSIDIEYAQSKDMTIGVLSDSVIEALSRLTEAEFELQFTSPDRAMIITPVDPVYDNEEITMLLMPMLVNE